MLVELRYKPFQGKNAYLYEDIFIWKVHKAKTTEPTPRQIIFIIYTIVDVEDLSHNKSHAVHSVTCSIKSELKRKNKIK